MWDPLYVGAASAAIARLPQSIAAEAAPTLEPDRLSQDGEGSEVVRLHNGSS
jgi:hypothetical protein